MTPARSGGDRRFGIEPPADQQPIRLFAGVDFVGHLAINIDEIFPCARAELGEVEVRVAPYERVGGPFDHLDISLQAPTALVLLQLKTESAPIGAADHAKDVRV